MTIKDEPSACCHACERLPSVPSGRCLPLCFHPLCLQHQRSRQSQFAIDEVSNVCEGLDLPLVEGAQYSQYVKNLPVRELIRLAGDRPGQLAHYRAAFYIGSATKASPEQFLKDSEVLAPAVLLA